MADLNLDSDDYYTVTASRKEISDHRGDNVGVFHKKSAERVKELSLNEDTTDLSKVEINERKSPNNNLYDVSEAPNQSRTARISGEAGFYVDQRYGTAEGHNHSTGKGPMSEKNSNNADQLYGVSERRDFTATAAHSSEDSFAHQRIKTADKQNHTSAQTSDQDNLNIANHHGTTEKLNHSTVGQSAGETVSDVGKELGEGGKGEARRGEEDEDMDELFRVEMERMARVSNKTIGSVRQLSLPESLDNSEATSSTGLPRSQTSTGPVTSSQAPPSSISLLRNWSISAYRYTWQPLSERFRKSSATNSSLQARAAALSESRAACVKLGSTAADMATHLDGVVKTQRALAREFLKLSIESPRLSREFLCNADTNDAIQKNGVLLVDAIRLFVAGIETLCNKTIDDTLVAVRNCEEARLEYEAYVWGLGTRQISAANQQQIDEKRAAYEKLTKHIEVKLELIEGNRIIVLRRQLVIFRNALGAYFSGNRVALEAIMKPIVEKSSTMVATCTS